MKRLALFAIAAAMIAAPASADVLFDNEANMAGAFGIFNPTHFPTLDGYVAQRFTLSRGATLDAAGFETNEVSTDPDLLAPLPTILANWMILQDNGGTPGAVIASDIAPGGAVAMSSAACIVADCSYSSHEFDLPDVALAAGSYFFALQGVADWENTSIGFSGGPGPLAFSIDGGASWQLFDGANMVPPPHGWSIALGGDLDPAPVPEPSTCMLLLAGFGAAGAALRRRPALI